MHIKKINKITELIDEKVEALTLDDIANYQAGDGLLTILENCIDEVLWNSDAIEEFWATYQSTTYDGTPFENNIIYDMLERYFFASIGCKVHRLERATKPMHICERCLHAIESHEGKQVAVPIEVEEDDLGKCDFCEDYGFSKLYELR